MNLWAIFHAGVLIDVFGVLGLPVIAFCLYFYVFYALLKYPSERLSLCIFIVLATLAMVINANGVRPSNDDIIKPLSLLAVMISPMFLSIILLARKRYQNASMWGIVTVAGWAHSLAWVVWMYALAKS